MNYAKITTCDICNGSDVGVVLWCQGCDLKCENCQNQETWEFNKGKPFTDYDFDMSLLELRKPYNKRFTLSGGHPLAPHNLETSTEICRVIKSIMPDKKIWLYTGYNFEDIIDYQILKYVDVLVDGRFIQSQRDTTLAFRGSANQRIIDVQASLLKKKVVLYEAS